MRSVNLQATCVCALRILAGYLVVSLGLVACTSRPLTPAPVEDRSPARGAARPSAPQAPVVGASGAGTAATAPVATASPVRPAVDAAATPGTYTVKPGDTLIRIGLDQGQSWRDIAKWNGIDNPNLIEVGQVLRVVPPASGGSGSAQSSPVTSGASVESRPLGPQPTTGPAASTPAAASGAPPASGAAVPPATASVGAAQKDAESDLLWSWPAQGSVVTGFDDSRNIKGLAIAGKAGEPVLAAADGRVVYAGSGLRGYGNLVIVKHNALYLSAYAHNQALLVKEDQQVKRGQKIAEMGATDAERVQLHFEIRRQGKPIDPARLLPAR